MELSLHRITATDRCTIGKLAIAGQFECFTLEDQLRLGQSKLAGETAIPAGRYQVIINRSQRFQRMLPLLLAVPEFSGIRIHGGNTAADTEGCILVGQSRGNDSILQSQLALGALQPKIAGALARGELVWITITNPIATTLTSVAFPTSPVASS